MESGMDFDREVSEALDRQAATQASIDAVRGESDGGELVDGYNCVDRGIEKKERDNQRKRGYRWRC